MQMERMKTSKMKYAPYNPRTFDGDMMERLKKSIKEFGYVEPIIVNTRNMHVVGGNQRLKALRELGISEVDVVLVELDDAKEKALNIALNKISGEWDMPKLREILSDLSLTEIDMDLTGFDPTEITNLTTSEGLNFDNDEATEDIDTSLGVAKIIIEIATEAELIRTTEELDNLGIEYSVRR